MPQATTLLAMAVLLGIVILVHEWGHYVAARLCGIRVDVFSIGFGPRIWGWKRGATDYRVSILPLGGYVKMAGDNPMEERAGAPDEFLSKPRWQRAIVAVAGPAMNIVLTLVAVWGLLWVVGLPYPAYYDWPAQIVAFPPDAPGAKAGLQVGDKIVQVNDTPTVNWKQAYLAIDKVEIGDILRITVERNGDPVTLKMQKAARVDPTGFAGLEPIPAVLDQVTDGRPAAIAGLKSGDKVLAVNGEPIQVWEQFTRIVRASGEEPLEFRVRRGEEDLLVNVTPATVEEGGRTFRQIGVTVERELAYEKANVLQAARQSGVYAFRGTKEILGVLGGLFRGTVSIKMLGGPVAIGREAGRAAREGLQRFVELIALISLNLAVLNLLPIPILDGGHLLLLAVEGTMRRDLSMAMKERFVQAGMVFLLVIFAIVMYNDVLKVLPGR